MLATLLLLLLTLGPKYNAGHFMKELLNVYKSTLTLQKHGYFFFKKKELLFFHHYGEVTSCPTVLSPHQQKVHQICGSGS